MDPRLQNSFRRGIDFFAIAAAGLLLFRLYALYATVGLRLNHDEAEHMHVALALERGEVPFLDFIENHPMLFHLGILALKRAFPQETVLGLYMLVRLSAFLAFAGCLYFVYRLCADYCRHEVSRFRAASVLLLVFIAFGILPEANSYLWDARPDWFCYLLSLACIHTHYRVHSRSTPDWTAADYLVLGLGGMAGGLGTAVLAKSLYIFAPYALVAGLIFAQRIRAVRMDLRRLLVANVLFVAAGILGFCLAVAGELHATGATLDAYYKANFVINRTLHLVTGQEDTPLSQLVAIAGGEFGTLSVVMSAAVLLLLTSLRNRRYFEFYTLLFSLSLIGFNIQLLASTNGAYWMHNLAPSVLGFLGIGFVLLHSILVWLSLAVGGLVTPSFSRDQSAALSSLIGYGGALLFVGVMGFSFAARTDEALAGFKNLQLSHTIRESIARGQPAELASDRLLPSDLVYLVFDPRNMPLRARHWGYYFMLGPDKGFWHDNHALGIGPDAATYWKSLFATAPPDAILFAGIKGGFLHARTTLLRNQGVDISWLGDRLNSDYVCVYQSIVTVYVRSDRMWQFGGPKWKRCPARPDAGNPFNA